MLKNINFAYLHFIFLNDKIRTEKVTNVKMSKKIKTGVVSEDELLLFYDYFKSNIDIDDNQYVIEVTNSRAAEAKYTQHE